MKNLLIIFFSIIVFSSCNKHSSQEKLYIPYLIPPDLLENDSIFLGSKFEKSKIRAKYKIIKEKQDLHFYKSNEIKYYSINYKDWNKSLLFEMNGIIDDIYLEKSFGQNNNFKEEYIIHIIDLIKKLIHIYGENCFKIYEYNYPINNQSYRAINRLIIFTNADTTSQISFTYIDLNKLINTALYDDLKEFKYVLNIVYINKDTTDKTYKSTISKDTAFHNSELKDDLIDSLNIWYNIFNKKKL